MFEELTSPLYLECSLRLPTYDLLPGNKANCTVPIIPTHPPCKQSFYTVGANVAVTEACNARQPLARPKGGQLTASLYPTAYGWGMKFQGRENQAGGPALSQNGNARLKSQPYHPRELASFVTTTLMSNSTKLIAPFLSYPPTLHASNHFTQLVPMSQ